MTVTEVLDRFRDTLLGRIVTALVAINIVDRALALSSKMFVVIIPLTILTGAVIEGESYGDTLVDRFGLDGRGAEATLTLFESPDTIKAGISFLGIGFLIFGSLSLARGLEAVYLDAWELKTVPGSVFRRLGWIASVVGFLAIAGPVKTLFGELGLRVTTAVVSLSLTTILWMWSPYLLLAQRMSWQKLLPTGLLTALATGALGVASLIYMPTVVTTDAQRYGLIGVAFALVSWLFAYCCAVIGAVVVAAVLAGRHPDRTTDED
ncbi:MAG: hypothetical protein JHC95_21360 [Solirubrobacteraceae bacterium]|nr:hypothetical protein [Solirubrobacteraceae bacterium]